MIQAYKGQYIKYESPATKQTQGLLVIEVINSPIQYVIIIDQNGLFGAYNFLSINAIKGYHHYTLNSPSDNFGIGGLISLNTSGRPGMFELLSEQTNIPYETIASAYGKALLQL